MAGNDWLPPRRHPSPSAQRRCGEHRRARVGVTAAAAISNAAAALVARLLRPS